MDMTVYSLDIHLGMHIDTVIDLDFDFEPHLTRHDLLLPLPGVAFR